MKLKEPAERLVSLAECRGYHVLGYWLILHMNCQIEYLVN